jgi:hypothetical protein
VSSVVCDACVQAAVARAELRQAGGVWQRGPCGSMVVLCYQLAGRRCCWY